MKSIDTQCISGSYITRNEVRRIMGVGRKPLCPRCRNPLSVISKDAMGFADMKCAKCKKKSIVDLHTLVAIAIIENKETE